jgi:hypothetical protein
VRCGRVVVGVGEGGEGSEGRVVGVGATGVGVGRVVGVGATGVGVGRAACRLGLGMACTGVNVAVDAGWAAPQATRVRATRIRLKWV